MAIPPWAAVMIVIGSLLVILLLIWLLCEADARRRRKRNRKVFEQTIYEQERNRAEDILNTLRTANIARAQAPSTVVSCPHGHQLDTNAGVAPPNITPTGASVYPSAVSSGYCPKCYPNGYPVDTTGGNLSLVVPQPPSPYPHPVAAKAQPSVIVNCSPCYTPCERYSTPNRGYTPGATEMMVVGVTPTMNSPEYTTDNTGGARLRLAERDEELPRSPPPIAPPGFVTVPMVAEHVS